MKNPDTSSHHLPNTSNLDNKSGSMSVSGPITVVLCQPSLHPLNPVGTGFIPSGDSSLWPEFILSHSDESPDAIKWSPYSVADGAMTVDRTVGTRLCGLTNKRRLFCAWVTPLPRMNPWCSSLTDTFFDQFCDRGRDQLLARPDLSFPPRWARFSRHQRGGRDA